MGLNSDIKGHAYSVSIYLSCGAYEATALLQSVLAGNLYSSLEGLEWKALYYEAGMILWPKVLVVGKQ